MQGLSARAGSFLKSIKLAIYAPIALVKRPKKRPSEDGLKNLTGQS